MDNLQGTTALKKNDSLSCSSCQRPLAPQLRVRPHEPLPLSQSNIDFSKHSGCRFIGQMAPSCPEDTICSGPFPLLVLTVFPSPVLQRSLGLRERGKRERVIDVPFRAAHTTLTYPQKLLHLWVSVLAFVT